MASTLVLLLAACGGEKPATGNAEQAKETPATGEAHEEGEAGKGSEVHLTAAQIDSSGVVVDTVQSAALTDGFSAPGRAVPGPQGAARVGTLLPGRIVRLLATEGGSVGRGTPLAVIESFDVAELKAELLTARAQAEQSRASLVRQEALAAENLTPARNVEEARAAYQTAVAHQNAAITKLSALGLSPASVQGAASAQFTVRSPIAGTITQREVTLGEYVEPSRDLFEVTAYGSSFVEAQVPSTQTGGLTAGVVAEVVTADGIRYAGRVVSVAPLVERESRTVPVRVALTSGSLRAETFVTVRFTTGAGARVLVVPPQAVERTGGETFVYVAVPGEAGTFRRTSVELGQETGTGVAVTSGLRAGDVIAVQGLFYLRSARQKGELSEHEH